MTGRLSDQLTILYRLLPYLWPRNRGDLKLRVGAAVAMLVAAKLLSLAVPPLLQQAVDTLNPKGSLAVALPLGLLLAYGAARIGNRLFIELRDTLFARVAENAVRQVGLNVFRHLHRLSLRFHLERQTGALSRAVDRGTKGIEFLLFYFLFNVVPTLIEILLVAGILWALFDWRFAAITLASIVAYIAFTFLVTEARIRYRRIMNDADGDANTKSIDSLLNYETVKYFNNEEHEAQRYDEALRTYEEAAIKSKLSLAVLNSGQAIVIVAGMIGLMLLAGMGVVAGTMTVGDFVMVNAYVIQLSVPLNMLGMIYREIKQSLIDMEVMYQLYRLEPEIRDKPGARPLDVDGGSIRFEKVSFGYDPRRPILNEVSFEVPAGRTLAIVGPSGAGKTTVGRLLFRFYEPSGGRILIDGQDIALVTQDSLRRVFGVVPQDTVLFNDTLAYNILYGRPDASEAEMRQAAEVARLARFVESLPDGYETVVGERGLKLSGGEKQRVALARMVLKEPAIQLFDEATSQLDTRTEREIQERLRDISRNRTTVMVAHRLSTVVEADDILVLDAGRVVERGRHRDLLARDGVYAAMWRRQQKAAAERDETAFDEARDDGADEAAAGAA
ncbi:MAG: ABCB family ABC transporter ATP-binding protein/permease [Kiloniellales bacterium]